MLQEKIVWQLRWDFTFFVGTMLARLYIIKQLVLKDVANFFIWRFLITLESVEERSDDQNEKDHSKK